MRKQLMAGTALVAAAMLVAGGALAADKKMMKPSISVNGYYDALIGGILDEDADTLARSEDTSAIDVRTDSEIHFNGRGTLENGLKVHVRTELEAQQGGGNQIDEYFLSVSGSFGQIILGGTAGAPVKMLTGLSGSWATGVGETLAFDSDDWTPSAADKTFGQLQHSRLDNGDANKATYISPKFGGFQVGLSYSPDETNDGTNQRINAEAERHNGLEGAVSYSGRFGDVGFGIGAGMTAYQGATEDDSKGDQSDWVVAARLDFGGGFRVSAAHKQTTDEADAAQGQVTDVGARFVTGANSFSLVGSMGEMDESGAQYTAAMASYARSLGAGAKWHANVIWNQSDNGASGADKKENTGTALVTGITVRF
jgi:predicted porin